MPVGANRVRELLGRLAAGSADARSMAADSVTDWTQAFDGSEAAIVARVLLWLALAETDGTAKEAQLHALAELAEWDLVPRDALQDVDQLTRAELHGSSIEHFDYLKSLQSNES
jgi:hypothetical protein